jgi:integrase
MKRGTAVWSIADIIPAEKPGRKSTPKIAASPTNDKRPKPKSTLDDEWQNAVKKGCRRVLALIEKGKIGQAKKLLKSRACFMPEDEGQPEDKSYQKHRPPVSQHIPWNKGKVIGQKPALQAKHVWAIRNKLEARNAKRDLALFNIAIDSKLIGAEVVRLRVRDVVFDGAVGNRAEWTRDNGKKICFEIGDESKRALADYLDSIPHNQDSFLFKGRGGNPLNKRQFARLVSQWITDIGLDDSAYGTHSLRRTKAMLIYERTGDLRIVQALLGHRKAETTVAYLGIGECVNAVEVAGQAGI